MLSSGFSPDMVVEGCEGGEATSPESAVSLRVFLVWRIVVVTRRSGVGAGWLQ